MALDLGELVAKIRMDSRQWKKDNKEAEADFHKLAGKLTKMAKVAGAAVAAAFGGGLLIQLGSAIKSASDLAETQSKVGVIFGKSADDIEAFASRAAEAMGQTKQQALDGAATFALYGKTAGLTGEHLVDFSTDLTTLASDMASFSNTSPQEAIEAIAAALRGESDPIEKYGVLLNEATIQQQAFKMHLIKTAKDALTPQQRVLAATAAIFAQTKSAQGDFARTSGGLANQQRILTAEFENAKAELGTGLLPVALKVVGVLRNVLAYVKENKSWLVPLVSAVGALGVVLWTIVNVVKAWTAVQWALNAALDANPIGLIILAIAALVGILIYAYTHSETFRKIVDGAWRGIKAAVSAVVGWIVGTAWPFLQKVWHGIATAALWLWHNVFVPVGVGIRRAIEGIVTVALWLWRNVFVPVGRGIAAAIHTIAAVAFWLHSNVFLPVSMRIRAVIFAMIKYFHNVAAVVMWLGRQIFGPIFAAIGVVIHALGAAAVWLYQHAILPAWNGIVTAVKFLGSVFVWLYANVIRPIWDAIVFAVHWLGDAFAWLYAHAIGPAITAIATAAIWVWKKVLQPAWSAISDGVHWLGNAFSSVFGKIKGWVVGAFEGAVDVAKGAINALIDLVNRAIGFINDRLITGLNAIPGVDFGPIPTLPRLARGGTIHPSAGGTPVIAGDGGEVEYGMPHSKMMQLLREAVRRGSGGEGGVRELHLIVHNTEQNRVTRKTARVQGNKATALVGGVL